MAQVPLDYFKQLMLKNFPEILTWLEIGCPVKPEALFILCESLSHMLTE